MLSNNLEATAKLPKRREKISCFRVVAPAVRVSSDIAFWFVERARREDSYLQPQKLQCLLYLAQGIYASSYYGRMLMPAVFLAGDNGPVEPNVAALFERGRPSGVFSQGLNPEIEFFLNDIWRSYGAYPSDKLSDRVARHQIVADSRAIGIMEEIPFSLMRDYFKSLKQTPPAKDGTLACQRADTIESADGRKLAKWRPRSIGKLATKKGILGDE